MIFGEAFVQEYSHAFHAIAGGGLSAVLVENSKEGKAMLLQFNFGGNGVPQTSDDLGAVPEGRGCRFETQLGEEMQRGINTQSGCRDLNHYRSHAIFPKLM